MCAIVLSSVNNCHIDGLKPALNQFWIDIQSGNSSQEQYNTAKQL